MLQWEATVESNAGVLDDERSSPTLISSRIRLATSDGAGLLDLRSVDAFEAGHLAGASSFPLSTLAQRTAELPPASCVGLRLLGAPAELARARAFLHDEGTTVWTIIDELTATPELWAAAEALGAMALGGDSRRLWLPSPHLPLIVPQLEAVGCVRRAVDLGCGRGRDCVWLAARGWSVVGVDNQLAFLDHLGAFAARHSLPAEAAVTPQLTDLRKGERAELTAQLAALLAPPLSLVVVSRFMARKLLDEVVSLMPAGCTLALHHFREGATSLKSGRPMKESDIDACALGPSECLQRWGGGDGGSAPPSSHLEVLLHCEDESVDGRPTVSFAVRKRDGQRVASFTPSNGAASSTTPSAATASALSISAIDLSDAPPPYLPSAESLASRDFHSLLGGRLLLSGKAEAADAAALRSARVAHIISLTPEPMPPPPLPHIECVHVPVSGGSSHADVSGRLLRAIEAVEAALAAQQAAAEADAGAAPSSSSAPSAASSAAPSASVLVHCSRGPLQGGVSGAVSAGYLLRNALAPSLSAALAACGSRPRGATLAALYALEMSLHGQPSDLSEWLGPDASTAVWDVAAGTADAHKETGVAPPPLPRAAAAGGTKAACEPGEGEAASAAAAAAALSGVGESIAVFRGRAMRLRLVSREPQIAAIANFLSAEEAERLVALARPQLVPSRVARTERTESDGGNHSPEEEAAGRQTEAQQWRSSSSCSIGGGARGRPIAVGEAATATPTGEQAHGKAAAVAAEKEEEDNAVVAAVIERATYLSGLSPHHAEDLQVVRYTPGQQYREHCDYFSPTQDAAYDERTAIAGNRLVSLFACLSPSELGGDTEFPRLGLRFGLRRGEALLWMNVERSGQLDARTLHAGRPVESGEKFGLNVWLRQRPFSLEAAKASAAAAKPAARKGGRRKGDASADDGKPTAWRPAQPPPRPTLASPAAQLSTSRREREW